MEQASSISVNPELEDYLARIGVTAAIGAPDIVSARLWSKTAIDAALHGVEQAATDFAALHKAKESLAADNPVK
jgi:hypothetical protein